MAASSRLVRKVLLALPALLFAAACRGNRTPPSPGNAFAHPPIVLVSIDTLRSDHLPVYGYRGVETPNIDRLRRDSILFSSAFSQVPLTFPSHVTILTGLLPADHGVRDNVGYHFDAVRHPPLAALLHAAGYITGASVAAVVLARPTGLAASFDFYDDAITAPAGTESLGRARRSGREALEPALRWLASVSQPASTKPFFLFLHLYEPHAPYDSPPPFRERYAERPYDGAIAAADAVVGDLLDALRRSGVYDRAAIVLLSDHGEGLGDHGEQEHGILLYREALAVPLLIKLPGTARAGQTESAPAGLVDVTPTLAAIAGESPPAGTSGKDLLALPRVRSIVSETFYPRIHLGWSPLRSIVDGSYHFIDGPRPELFAVASDAGERRDVFGTNSARAREMKRELDRTPARFDAPSAAGAEQVRQLASLGYLSASGTVGSGPLPNPADHIGDIAKIQTAFRIAASADRAHVIPLFRALLAENPRLFDVQYRLAETLRDLGRGREAEEEFGRAIAISPSLAGTAALEIARLAVARGDWTKAEGHARIALAASPAAAHEILARSALGRGDVDRALSEAGLALEDRTDPAATARAAVVAAGAELARGKPADALALLDREEAQLPSAHSLPRDFEFFRGDALARSQRNAEAEAAFRREIAAHRDNADAYARLAVVLAIEHRRVEEINGILESMDRAVPGPATDLLAARTLDSIGDHSGAAKWRLRAGGHHAAHS